LWRGIFGVLDPQDAQHDASHQVWFGHADDGSPANGIRRGDHVRPGDQIQVLVQDGFDLSFAIHPRQLARVSVAFHFRIWLSWLNIAAKESKCGYSASGTRSLRMRRALLAPNFTAARLAFIPATTSSTNSLLCSTASANGATGRLRCDAAGRARCSGLCCIG